jgi:hypothetical protein
MPDKPRIISCHCGAVRIEVDAELTDLSECNCSTCARHGFIHWKMPMSALRLLTEKCTLATYLWRDVTGHQFCPNCGTGLLRAGYPSDRISVNARCIEGIDVFELEVRRYDGRREMPPGPLRSKRRGQRSSLER